MLIEKLYDDRVFPIHDAGYGNLQCLPLQIRLFP